MARGGADAPARGRVDRVADVPAQRVEIGDEDDRLGGNVQNDDGERTGDAECVQPEDVRGAAQGRRLS